VLFETLVQIILFRFRYSFFFHFGFCRKQSGVSFFFCFAQKISLEDDRPGNQEDTNHSLLLRPVSFPSSFFIFLSTPIPPKCTVESTNRFFFANDRKELKTFRLAKVANSIWRKNSRRCICSIKKTICFFLQRLK